MLIVGGSIGGAVIMFIWDYLAYIMSSTDEMCVQIFSGNTFFRKILCFLLKIISMQVVPCIVYYIIFYKRKSQFLSNEQERQISNVDYLDDDAASDLNRTLTSRMDSRRSLFSGMGSTTNLWQMYYFLFISIYFLCLNAIIIARTRRATWRLARSRKQQEGIHWLLPTLKCKGY